MFKGACGAKRPRCCQPVVHHVRRYRDAAAHVAGSASEDDGFALARACPTAVVVIPSAVGPGRKQRRRLYSWVWEYRVVRRRRFRYGHLWGSSPRIEVLRRLWQPSRVSGDATEERDVSFLELFSDLVYVALVAAVSHDLAHHMEWAAVVEFGVMFGLTWIAWLNGTAEFDLHGRDDLRARAFTFAQMLLVVLLAVYATDAQDGRDEFAVVYCVLFGVLAWQWHVVHRGIAALRRRRRARWYQALAGFTVVAMGTSTAASAAAQRWVWAVVVAVWVGAGLLLALAVAKTSDETALITRSFVERFGLFTIIVLGEVVFGVVNGVLESPRDARTVSTAVVALCVGFGLWWNYFDLAARRLPRPGPAGLPLFVPLHLPLTMSIAAAGAAMVAFIEHATDPRAPAVASWVLAGSVAVFLVSLASVVYTLDDWHRHRGIYLPAAVATIALTLAAVPPLMLWRPSPITLAGSLLALLAATWTVALYRWIVTTATT